MARSDSAVQVYNYVREQIIQRRFFPGTQIVEEELASAVQTSRATVRNALTRLHYDGLVDLILKYYDKLDEKYQDIIPLEKVYIPVNKSV